MLDLRLFRSRSFAAVMSLAAGIMFGFAGISLIVVRYWKTCAGWTPSPPAPG